MLRGIEQGLFILSSNLETGRKLTQPPTLICLTDMGSPSYNGPSCQGYYVGWMVGTGFIYLCPYFWTNLAFNPRPSDCNTLNAAGTQLLGKNFLLGSQYVSLVSMLSSLYLIRPLQPLVYDTMEAINLPASKKAISANNYALYLGSEWSLIDLYRLLCLCL